MRIHTNTLSIAILTVLLSLSVACSKSKPTDDSTSKPSDDTITKDVQAKVAADPDTKDTNVTVVAKEGKVTLTGKAKTPVAQKKVEQVAREEPGVAAVDDQIAVEPVAEPVPVQAVAPPPPPPPKPIVVPAPRRS